MLVTINPGPCKMVTKIRTSTNDEGLIDLDITTDCSHYAPILDKFKDIDAYSEIFTKYGENTVVETCKQYCKHSTCPVPIGILKAIEAEASLALPTDVSIAFEKE